jgi:hypothetical protein
MMHARVPRLIVKFRSTKIFVKILKIQMFRSLMTIFSKMVSFQDHVFSLRLPAILELYPKASVNTLNRSTKSSYLYHEPLTLARNLLFFLAWT